MTAGVKSSPSAVLLTLGFSLLMALPVLLMPLVNHEARERWEKRPLVSWAEVRDQFGRPRFFDTLGKAIDDHLFPALKLNRVYRKFQYYGLHDSPVRNVALGEEGLVFLTAHDSARSVASLKHFCRPDLGHVEQLHGQLTDFAHTLHEKNVSLILAVVPSKLALYADRLPASISRSVRDDCESTIASGALVAQQLSGRAENYRVVYPLDRMSDLRDSPHFYPPANFHANSRINHEFAREYMRQLGIADTIPGVDPSLEIINADLRMLGFKRKTHAWRYHYAQGVDRHRRVPAWLREVYPNIRSIGMYSTRDPLSEKRALVLSNSFGAFIAPHLAPGYRNMVQTNIQHLKDEHAHRFLEVALTETDADHLVLLYHDEGLNPLFFTTLAGY